MRDLLFNRQMVKTHPPVMTHASFRVHDFDSGAVEKSHDAARQRGLKVPATSDGHQIHRPVFAHGVLWRGWSPGVARRGLLQTRPCGGPLAGHATSVAHVEAHRMAYKSGRPVSHVLAQGATSWHRLGLVGLDESRTRFSFCARERRGIEVVRGWGRRGVQNSLDLLRKVPGSVSHDRQIFRFGLRVCLKRPPAYGATRGKRPTTGLRPRNTTSQYPRPGGRSRSAFRILESMGPLSQRRQKSPSLLRLAVGVER